MREEFNGSILKVLLEGFLINKKSLVREYILLPNDTSNIFIIFYQYRHLPFLTQFCDIFRVIQTISGTAVNDTRAQVCIDWAR